MQKRINKSYIERFSLYEGRNGSGLISDDKGEYVRYLAHTTICDRIKSHSVKMEVATKNIKERISGQAKLIDNFVNRGKVSGATKRFVYNTVRKIDNIFKTTKDSETRQLLFDLSYHIRKEYLSKKGDV